MGKSDDESDESSRKSETDFRLQMVKTKPFYITLKMCPNHWLSYSYFQIERKLEVYLRSVERYKSLIYEIKDTNSKYQFY